MNLLLVDDEAGIREGLASFLRLKGYGVQTAGSSLEARDTLQSDAFDLVITDWRLADGSAETFLPLCDCPTIVMSGYPEEVIADELTTVLSKPVSPHRLLEKIEALEVHPQAQTELPADTRDRVTLVLALLGDPQDVEILDDGSFTTVKVRVVDLSDERIAQIELIGGDLRVWGPSDGQRLELRLYRNGRPASIGLACSPWADWPDDQQECAVDLSCPRVPTPAEFLQLLERVQRARDSGREVRLLNVPPHLRLYAEISGRGHDMPNREKAGPRLPEVLAELWS